MEKIAILLNSDRVDRDFPPYREQLSCNNGGVLWYQPCQNSYLKYFPQEIKV
ncbi:MAG TPA: hypothetical protein VJ912_02485 [Candidatus Nanoarchaeia archaeon]|nr:hypothetical protein [Candidatus Nanoarchaeia archaeon]